MMVSFQDFNNRREHLVDADYRLKNTCHCVEFEASWFCGGFYNILNVIQ